MSSAPEVAETKTWDDHIGPLTHELRQEVSAVLHQVELLKTSAIDELTRRRSIGAIEHNAEILMAFVDDLVCLGRVNRGDVRVKSRSVDVEDLIVGSGRDRTRQVRFAAPPDHPSEVLWTETDPIIVDQIVTVVLDRYDREGLVPDAVVSASALRADDGAIDVVFTSGGSSPIEIEQFRSATLDDGLSLYLARRLAGLLGADVGVLRSGRRDSFLLRLPAVGASTSL
jgi:hypothetical protein